MTGTVSTILVMGPPGAGKSDFINLLAGPVKLQPNGVPTDNLRAIAISLYFSGDETIRLVKFPGFDESSTDPTDTKLFVDLATFLDSCHRRDEPIQSIIYLHPVTHDGLNVADVEFNVKMLQEIAKDVMRNVVVVTTKWDRIPESDRDSKEAELRNGLMRFYQEPFMRHDGTKWSALSILSHAKRKTPKLLNLKNEIPSYTSAGLALSDHIGALIESRQEQETRLKRQIRAAKAANDRDTVKQLDLTLKELKVTVVRLENGINDLDVPINWEQAARDNEALKGAIKKRHDSVTTDWKVEYDKLLIKNRDLQTRLDTAKAENDSLVKDSERRAQIDEKYHSYPFIVPVRATNNYAGDGGGWLPYSAGELLHTDGHAWKAAGGYGWLIQNSAGRIGVASPSNLQQI